MAFICYDVLITEFGHTDATFVRVFYGGMCVCTCKV